jgi:hypothetical protein
VFCLPIASDYRKTLRRSEFSLLGLLALIAASLPNSLWAQGGFSATPQTNLGPIGPSTNPTGGFGGGYSGPPPTGSLSPVSPGFDPYATTTGGTAWGVPNLSPPGFGAGGNYGGATVTPLGPPTPVGAPSYSAGPPVGASIASGAGGPNAAYPNGSLLGGLFSGSLFRGNSSNVYQGAGYTAPGGFAFGSTPATAAQYNAPSVYGGQPYPGQSYGGQSFGAPAIGSGSLYGDGPMLTPPSPSTYGGDPFPASAYPSGSPTSLFPGGFNGGGYGGSLLPGGLFSGGLTGYQLLHGPRLRHTFISGGDNQDDLGMNQTDFSLGFAFGNFFYSNRPLYVVPSFSLYLFDGPITIPAKPADMPGSAYGGFIDFGWQTDPNQIIGAEFGVRVGVFSDFDTFNSDSIRVMGKGLGSFRLTPTSTVKAGVYYLDRESIKILPAGGLLWQPDPYTRFDIFFPEPKLAKYWRTIGTQDVWWYVAGEYGGDSWTITRSTNTEERVDINQVAITFGWEWGRSDLIRMGQRTAFIEFGGVFARELKYETSPHDQDLGEALMVRAGFGY